MQSATLITYSLVAATSVVIPGPATMLAIRNGAAGGVRAVLPSTLGNMTGLFLLSAAAMLGLGMVLQSSAMLFMVLKVAGAAYLIYMGLRHLLGRAHIAPPETASTGVTRRGGQLYLEATFVAAMNPKPILFFTALFPQFLNAHESLLPQFFALTGIFMAMSMVSLLTYGTLAHRARRLLRQPRIVVWLNRLVGSIFVAFGLALLRLKRSTT
ncbi:LysE family translocator [Achromobacter pestifer]|uniref:Homoserine/homoserine lactone efflux protein n=1 Tax=Achromobacter pestifer TaxID=1353889 RepID=A0A6S7B6F6_9BURK|nr:LysE family translocator [Achromobacter pestifer]CAB3700170.1 Homoserine/homoserine lactone efflux protein [Achromobacter pestifer]